MSDEVILNKIESLRRCVTRIETKTPADVTELIEDIDLQDIIVLNLERAVQLCVDIGLQIIGKRNLPVPDTMSETFRELAKHNIIDVDNAECLIRAVGFRNTAVHAYQEIDWNIVFTIVTTHLQNFRIYVRSILKFLDPKRT